VKYLFGPVPSRRLGYSLGVDLVPEKTCSFSCIYCQVGKTAETTVERAEFYPTKKIIAELTETLPKKGVHFITFSGSGEPTLHSGLGKIIKAIKKLCDTPVCVITNSSLIWRKDVQQDLMNADVVMPSLDAVDPETFAKINRPSAEVSIDKIVKGLEKFRKVYKGQIWLEIMLVKGFNDGLDQVSLLKEAAMKIEPDEIHLNTVVRPPQSKSAKALDETEMARITGVFGGVAKVLTRFDKNLHSFGEGTDLDQQVFELSRRRGVTVNDLVSSFGFHRDVANDILARLLEQGKIKKVSHAGKTYFQENF
jgi:wyosine [tRNA(Phe)-imidazoG37] synthetase (radical SAM superfamily)